MVQYIVVVHIMAQNSIEFVFEAIKYALIATGSNFPPAQIAPPPKCLQTCSLTINSQSF